MPGYVLKPAAGGRIRQDWHGWGGGVVRRVQIRRAVRPKAAARWHQHQGIAAAYDMIYRPAETPVLHAARAAGARTANGLGMLLYQGAKALEIWTGQPAPVAVMRRHVACQVTPVQPQLGQRGVLHGRRRGMLDGMAEHRAKARGSINWLGRDIRHAGFIGGGARSSKPKDGIGGARRDCLTGE